MKRTVLITVVFGLISALSTYLLFHSMEGFKNELKESSIAVKDMKAQVKSIENNYKTEIHYWVSKNKSLQQQIQKTDVALNQSRQKEKSLQKKVQQMISNDSPAQQLVVIPDTVTQTVTQYITETNKRDSLCDEQVSQLSTVIQTKDSAFAVCERSFMAMQKSMDVSLAQQNFLAQRLNDADKKLKSQSRNSKFMAGGLMFLSGFTTVLLLNK